MPQADHDPIATLFEEFLARRKAKGLPDYNGETHNGVPLDWLEFHEDIHRIYREQIAILPKGKAMTNASSEDVQEFMDILDENRWKDD